MVSVGVESSRLGFVLCSTKVTGSGSRTPTGLLGHRVCVTQQESGERALEEGELGDSLNLRRSING